MEKRKLQNVGRGAMSITLPIEWIRENNLEKGDELEVTMREEGSLLIGFDKPPETEKRIRIYLDADESMLEEYIIATYTAGYNTIEIQRKDGGRIEKADLVHRTLRNMVAIEVLKDKPTFMSITCLINDNTLSLEEVLEKMRTTIESMFDSVVRGASKEELLERELEIRKFALFACRYLRVLSESPKQMRENNITNKMGILAHWSLFRGLERIGDAFLEPYSQKKVNIKEIKILKDFILATLDALKKKDLKKLSEISKKAKAIVNNEGLKHTPRAMARNIGRICDILFTYIVSLMG